VAEDNNPSAVPDILISQVRIALVAVSGWMVGQGYITAEMGAQVGGAAVIIGTALWSWYANWKKNQKLKDAIAAPVGKAAP
jgi:hypothetical protein